MLEPGFTSRSGRGAHAYDNSPLAVRDKAMPRALKMRRFFVRSVKRAPFLWGLAGLLALCSIGWETSDILGGRSLDSKTVCVIPQTDASTLASFSQSVGRPVNCVVLFNDANPGWAEWTSPWFTHASADENWSTWVKADPAVHRVVVTQEMIPSNVPANWRELGASGAYDQYAHQLAVNLVAAGMGNAIIRLGEEANGTWYNDSLGNNPAEYHSWAVYWARIVKVMRAVPGSNFLFDWCINAGYRDIPFSSYYPGNDVVDIIGLDIYDSGMPGDPANETSRWNSLDREPSGLIQVVAFAHRMNKPLSIPEWGLVSTDQGGSGDDPTYVRGIASIVKQNQVVFEAYFDKAVGGTMLLQDAPQSFKVWEQYFGTGHVAAGRPW